MASISLLFGATSARTTPRAPEAAPPSRTACPGLEPPPAPLDLLETANSWIIARMALAENQLRFLRGRAHPLKPVILVGQQGLTDAVASETARALGDHELIKVKVRGADRAARDGMLADLARRTGSELVTRIGHVAVFYRRRDHEPRLPLPEPAGAPQT